MKTTKEQKVIIFLTIWLFFLTSLVFYKSIKNYQAHYRMLNYTERLADLVIEEKLEDFKQCQKR